jgi:hypothetical protein
MVLVCCAVSEERAAGPLRVRFFAVGVAGQGGGYEGMGSPGVGAGLRGAGRGREVLVEGALSVSSAHCSEPRRAAGCVSAAGRAPGAAAPAPASGPAGGPVNIAATGLDARVAARFNRWRPADGALACLLAPAHELLRYRPV